MVPNLFVQNEGKILHRHIFIAINIPVMTVFRFYVIIIIIFCNVSALTVVHCEI